MLLCKTFIMMIQSHIPLLFRLKLHTIFKVIPTRRRLTTPLRTDQSPDHTLQQQKEFRTLRIELKRCLEEWDKTS